MKTVKEIAKDLEVSYQTVYNHMDKNEEELTGHIFKKKGTSYIDTEGVDIIKKSLGLIQVPIIKEEIGLDEVVDIMTLKIADKLDEKFNEQHNELKQEIELLKKQNEELIRMIQEQQQKKSLFDRIFNKN